MISIVNTECHVPKTFSDLAKIAAWGRLGQLVFGVSKSRLRQGREQHLAQQPYAEQPLFGIGEAGEEPVEPAERQCAFALRERQLFGWGVAVSGEGMEALHTECVVNAKTLHNCSDGW